MAISLERIKKRPDFLRVAALRRKWATLGLILQVAPTPEHALNLADGSKPVGFDFSGSSALEPEAQADQQVETMQAVCGRARVGFTTSKKVGNAVARNRARRRLRAAVAEVFPKFAQPGNDYVVIGRTETITRDYSLLLQDLKTALKRTGALVTHAKTGAGGDGERKGTGDDHRQASQSARPQAQA